MRSTAVAVCFNAPRWISASGPLIAGTLIVGLGGFGSAATIVGLFFIVGVVAAPFLPETNGLPLPDTLEPAGSLSGASPLRAVRGGSGLEEPPVASLGRLAAMTAAGAIAKSADDYLLVNA